MNWIIFTYQWLVIKLQQLRADLSLFWGKIESSSFWVKIEGDVSDLWEKDKGFVLAFGVIILSVKFRNLLISWITYFSKLLFQKAEQESNQLQQNEQNDNSSAEALIKQAESLDNSDIPDDWNKK